MDDHFSDIYANKADLYDRLISREDHAGNILAALKEIVSLDRQSTHVVEFGAGTGRITCMLAPLVKRIQAFDQSRAMLAIADTKLTALVGEKEPNFSLQVADNKSVPVADQSAHISVAAWTFGHQTAAEGWRSAVVTAVKEMQRVLCANGTAIVFETLGTNRDTPNAPTPALRAYYDMLEGELGFRFKAIRTDYLFESNEEAVNLISFFFGSNMADSVRRTHTRTVPEYTGMWWWTRSTTIIQDAEL